MKPENQSLTLLGATRARAKMYEYDVPEADFIRLYRHPEELLMLTIGILGDYNNTSEAADSEEGQKSNLLFSAQFFDAFLNARLNKSIGDYLLVLGSAAYYLCDLPGSSKVLIGGLSEPFPDLGAAELEFFLIGLLNHSFNGIPILQDRFSDQLAELITAFELFFSIGEGDDTCLILIAKLRNEIYQTGTDRQLLLIDTIESVIKRRFVTSTWKLLPSFTNANLDSWRPVLSKPGFIKEFWPAQILLGEHNVYRGKSAVIQMPTSAGKTKSIELILRANFMTTDSLMSIVVAPFKALCNEIKHTLQAAFAGEKVQIDAPSDAFQFDFFDEDDIGSDEEKLILILTPEKLLYMIRQSPEITANIGLLIYDEAHQFDNGIRGVTYELLLSSLRLAVSPNTQIILISAVIQNAIAIGQWLIGAEAEVVNGANLLPTYRTIGFTSWNDTLGRVEYVRPEDPETDDFFVPRVLQISTLASKPRETAERKFPDKHDGKSIAVYLALKLVKNGALAIFCGSKPTVNSISEQVLNLVDRKYTEVWPSSFSNQNEIVKLKKLHESHFGVQYVLTRNCEVGVFAHSGNTPQGLRLSIEYAMQHGHIRFLICTSTLAQGVNLPIKYLLVTSFYQAQEKIKTRDFHNLIGRAGRSGIHTEGSVLFTDPQIYDLRRYSNNAYTWNLAKDLLDANQSEPCTSTILHLFDPIFSVSKQFQRIIDLDRLAEAYTAGAAEVGAFINEVYNRNVSANFPLEQIVAQVHYKLDIFAAIESYLMAHWESRHIDNNEDGIMRLAEATLAYALSTKEQQELLKTIFATLAERINIVIPSAAKKARFGKTLLGVNDILDVEEWVVEHLEILAETDEPIQLLELIWPLITKHLSQKSFNKLFPETSRYQLAEHWLTGASYVAILTLLSANNAYTLNGSQHRAVKQETVIEIADGALGYDATLVLTAIAEILRLESNEVYQGVLKTLDLLQKQLKYGLPSALSIAFYEQGFADRLIAQHLAGTFPDFPTQRSRLLVEIVNNADEIKELLKNYPAYFTYVLNTLKT